MRARCFASVERALLHTRFFRPSTCTLRDRRPTVPQSYWFDIPSNLQNETLNSAKPVDAAKVETTNAGRILIADDQPTVLEALRLMLKCENYDVELAATPQATLDALRGASFDAVLIDLNYTLDTTSGAEGLDLLAQIKQVRPETPVMV